MSQTYTTTASAATTFQGMPWEFDVLEADLDSKYPNFAEGNPILWAAAVGAAAGSWSEETRIRGIDWIAEFHPPKSLKTPYPRPSRWRTINECCVLFSINTQTEVMNEARDKGRVAIRALVGLLRRDFPTIVPGKLLWEGAITKRGTKIRMSSAGSGMAASQPASSKKLHRVGLKFAKVETAKFPVQLTSALKWMNLSRSATVRSEKFFHLWLALLTLASYGQSRKRGDMARIRRYTATMGHGIGGVRSPLNIAELNQRVGVAYRVRNRLIHEAAETAVTIELLDQLEAVAYEFVDFELAKLGINIPP